MTSFEEGKSLGRESFCERTTAPFVLVSAGLTVAVFAQLFSPASVPGGLPYTSMST
jgi:hypothetical protein